MDSVRLEVEQGEITMSISKKLFASTVCAMALFYGTTANAQATRTWVSGVGDDVNPCSRTAPCKTFAGAISKTAAGGEINCLDPGGFGAVTINKSMTINCLYTEGGVLAGGNGITVNMPASTDVAFLRGLDIFGVSPPTHGIRMVGQGTLHVEESTIRRFNSANSFGISFQPTGPSELHVRNTTIAENGSGASGGGILINPTGASGVGRVFLNNVRVDNNANIGLSVTTAGNSAFNGINVVVENSSFSGNTTGVSLVTPAGTTSASMMMNESAVVNNDGTGIVTDGATALMRVANTTVTGNAQGLSAVNSSTLLSFGNNRVLGNPFAGPGNNGSFTAPPIASQ
jgi:hypothetical protein